VEDCKEIIGQNNKFWRMSCLNHFLETHVDKLINSMRYKVSFGNFAIQRSVNCDTTFVDDCTIRFVNFDTTL
jgi:hypothetical protein